MSHNVSEQLSMLQGGFKRTLMTESKAFKAEATAFRRVPSFAAPKPYRLVVNCNQC